MPEADARETPLLEDLALIRMAAAQAGEIALGYFRKDPEVWMKAGDSPVSEADYAVDRFLRRTLTAARPDYGWLSEESAGGPDRLAARRTFVVDPIDGTRAFLSGGDIWCISIAVVEEGRPLVGVLDCPARGEVFEGSTGHGSCLNGRRLVRPARSAEPLVAGPKPIIARFGQGWNGRLRTHPYVPSLAYRIAMLASGGLDGTFVKPLSRDWDLAAADLILEEVGGCVLDHAGAKLRYAGKETSHGILAAGSGPLLDAMVSTIARIEP